MVRVTVRVVMSLTVTARVVMSVSVSGWVVMRMRVREDLTVGMSVVVVIRKELFWDHPAYDGEGG